MSIPIIEYSKAFVIQIDSKVRKLEERFHNHPNGVLITIVKMRTRRSAIVCFQIACTKSACESAFGVIEIA